VPDGVQTEGCGVRGLGELVQCVSAWVDHRSAGRYSNGYVETTSEHLADKRSRSGQFRDIRGHVIEAGHHILQKNAMAIDCLNPGRTGVRIGELCLSCMVVVPVGRL